MYVGECRRIQAPAQKKKNGIQTPFMNRKNITTPAPTSLTQAIPTGVPWGSPSSFLRGCFYDALSFFQKIPTKTPPGDALRVPLGFCRGGGAVCTPLVRIRVKNRPSVPIYCEHSHNVPIYKKKKTYVCVCACM